LQVRIRANPSACHIAVRWDDARGHAATIHPIAEANKLLGNGKTDYVIKSKAKRKKRLKVGLPVAEEDDHTPCRFCGKQYNTKEDDKITDEWLQCRKCKIWAHETCAEQHGVIGDDDFFCENCVA
jgi:hypothetical protein